MPEVIPYCMKLALIKNAFAIHKSPLLNIKTTIQQNSFPEIVVSVIVDNGGSGSSVAAPIARDIINYYFENIKPKVAMQ